MRLSWTPLTNYDRRGIHVTNGLRVCATAQPRRLTTNYGNHPRASAQNRNFSKTPSTIKKIQCRGRGPKKADHHGGATISSVPTGITVNRIWTGFRASYVTAYFYLLWGDRRNRPQIKCGKNDGAL